MSKILFENADIQFIDGDRGKNYPKQNDFLPKGDCLFLSAKNVTATGFLFDDMSFISKEKDLQLKAGKLQKNDIVITTRGTIGNVALYDESIPFKDIRINSGMLIFRANDEIWDIRFLYNYLRSEEFEEQVKTLISGSAVPQLPVRDIKKLSIPHFNKEKQKQISDKIELLNQKIQLNTQTNQTLEAIAQAIFKSWFVDFDPVHAKANALADGASDEQATLSAMSVISGKSADELIAMNRQNPDHYQKLWDIANAFPSGFDGEVPLGWGVKKIGEVVERLRNSKKLKKEQISQDGENPVFEQGMEILMGYTNETASFLASPKNPIFIFGDHTCVTHLSTKPFCIYQNVIAVKGLNLPTYWVYWAIYGKQEFQEYRRHWAEFIVKEIVVPNDDFLCQEFSKIVGVFHENSDLIMFENKELVQTRDELLPKLLSGGIEL